MPYPKRVLLFAVIILLSACKQESVTCVRHFTLLPCSVAFVGFESEDLDTIICARYEANTTFVQLRAIDTLLFDTVFMQGDTAYTAHSVNTYTGFFNLETGIDYRLSFPGNPKTYTITGIASGPLSDTFIVTNRPTCPNGTGGPWFVTVASNVNNEPSRAFQPNFHDFFIAIRR